MTYPKHRVNRVAGFRHGFLTVAALTLIVGCATPALAQPSRTEPDPPGQSQGDAASTGRATPRGAVRAFLDACRADDHETAARYMDLSHHGPSDGPGLARQFSFVLDHKLWFDLERLSPDPEGDLEDDLPPDVERVGTIRTSQGDIDILMDRVTSETGRPVWQFASSTVDRVPALYDEFGYGVLGEVLPETFFKIRFLEVQMWQWLGVVLSAFVVYVASWIVIWVLYRALRSVVSRTETRVDDALLDITVKPARLALAGVLFYVGMLFLRLAAPAHDFFTNLIQALVLVSATWLILRLVDGVREQVERHLEEKDKSGALAVIPLGVKTAKTAVVVLALIALLQHFGFNVTGIIAGLGVGGIALALAAQKTIENLFGGVTLIADQPVRVGDFCRFGDKVGTVEDVGLRSTRVRTLDRTMISIPNGDFSQTQLENFGQRDRIRLLCTIGLRYETTPDQLRHVITGLRKLLVAHPRVTPEPRRVRFVGFGAYSLDLEVFAYVSTADWSEFLRIREDIFLRMMDIVAESGTGFAFPSQTTYLSRDGGLDAERSRKAEETVGSWREASRLPFPDLDPETVAEIERTLDYPPRGSASAETAL